MLSKQDIQKNVAANFKYTRMQLGLKQVEMAKQLGISDKTIGAIEEGRALTVENVYKLSCLTKISMDTIFLTQLSNQISK